jgi:hypothetical protein
MSETSSISGEENQRYHQHQCIVASEVFSLSGDVIAQLNINVTHLLTGSLRHVNGFPV